MSNFFSLNSHKFLPLSLPLSKFFFLKKKKRSKTEMLNVFKAKINDAFNIHN
jgi:hypothetical protein